MNDVDLSIIIPVYNCEKYIEECILSIIKQEKDFVEIIIINDGSTDNTLKKCNEFVQNYNNIKLINQKNKGVSYSRNVGIESANGQYIMFLDADDYLDEKSLDNFQKDVFSGDIDVLRYSYIVKDNNKERKVIFENETFDLTNDRNKFFNSFFQKTNQNMIWGQAIKKEILNDIKFKENIFYGEDLLFNSCLYSKCKNIRYTDRILYIYKQNVNSVTRDYKNLKVKNKIENLIYVFNEIMLEYKDAELTKEIENKFIGEVVPQIMMLTFDQEINKSEVIKQMKEVLENEILEKVFKDIDKNELTMCKYKQVYKFMKNKEAEKVYLYSKMYKHLKMIQQFIKCIV